MKIDKGFNLFNNNNNFKENNNENKVNNENSISSIFDILEENLGKIQYLIVFCLSE